MRGSEDLGGGLKANFQIETSLGSGTNGALNSNVDATGAFTHATNVGNRAMWASITTAGGLEVRGGLQDQFIRTISLAYNGDGTTNVVGNLLAGNSGAFAGRHNAISVTQTMGGLKFGAAMTGRSTEVTNTADVDAGKGYEVMANYTAGKFAIGGALRKTDTSNGASAATGIFAADVTQLGAPAVAAASVQTETQNFGASYDFGVAKAFVGYATQDTQDQLVVGARKANREVTTLGVNTTQGKTDLFLTYSMGETTAAPVGAVSRDIDGYVLGARYNLSKRTNLYAIYGTSDVDAGNAPVADTSTKTTQYALGLNHKF
jgi:predicted porin